jgi:putative addiction module killer protein
MVWRSRCHGRREGDDGGPSAGAGKLFEREGVGTGIFEYRIDFGPGYRVYFGKDGNTVVILLGGGTKKRQNRDIATAQECWEDYKKRKPREK